ncbi:MAG TPA: hypothetical protein VF078_06600, partial [Nitrospira sp.]
MPGDYTYTKEYICWFTADEEVRRDWFEPRLDGRPLFRHQQALGLEYKVLGLFPIDLGQLGKITSSHATMTGRDLLVGRINQQSRMVVGERIHPVPIPSSWLRRVGSYDIIDVGQEETLLDRLRLTVQDGFLVLTGRFTKPTPLSSPMPWNLSRTLRRSWWAFDSVVVKHLRLVVPDMTPNRDA